MLVRGRGREPEHVPERVAAQEDGHWEAEVVLAEWTSTPVPGPALEIERSRQVGLARSSAHLPFVASEGLLGAAGSVGRQDLTVMTWHWLEPMSVAQGCVGVDVDAGQHSAE